MIPVSCSKCKESVKQGEMELHRRNSCPEEFIIYPFEGCSSKVLRKDLNGHLKDEAASHLLYIKKSFDNQLVELEQRFEKKEQKIRDEKIHNLERALTEANETKIEWKVKNWSTVKRKSYLQSDKFSFADFNWFIGFYTDGDNEESKGFVSVYLFLDVSSTPKNKNVTIEFYLKFINHKDPNDSVKKEFKTTFPIKGGQGWGDRKAIKGIKLTEETGFLKQDTLHVDAQIMLKRVTYALQ